VRGDLDVLHSLYSQAVMRAFYSFEESTAGIRNELGDYYLGQQDLVSAILQFRRVLAIDPSDLAARFRLGKVYQWNRDWHAALESYGAVYKVDPGYENVAGLYNELARDHADSLSSTASYLADTTHVQWHAEGAYSLPLDSLWGVTASYQTDAVQTDFDPSLSPRSAYQVHDFSAGVPVDLYFMGVRLTPQAGGILTGSLLYAPVDPGGGTALAASALAASYRAFPYGRADLLLTAGRLFTLASTLRLGPYPETLDPLRTLAYDSSAEANLIVPLSFIDVYPLRDTTLRTYGKLDYLTGAGFTYRNLIATAAEEVTVHVLKGGSPYSLLTLIGNFTFQHSLAYEAFDYYSPIAELSAGGSLMGSTWLDAGAGSVLGLSLRAYGGVYQQRLFGEQYGLAPGTYAKVEVQADASLTRDGSGYTLTLLGNTTFPASYWSLYLRLDYTLKLPRLLAP
jgi:tetratricopeptide (TPR) repeat protein